MAHQIGNTLKKPFMAFLLLLPFLFICIEQAQSLGDYGGTYWENLLETPIDLREPRSFPQSGLLVVRQKTFKTLHKGSSRCRYARRH